MMVRQGFVTNSSSSSFIVWSKEKTVTPEMVTAWGIPERVERYLFYRNWEEDRGIDLSVKNITRKINEFKYELDSRWVDIAISIQQKWIEDEQNYIENIRARCLAEGIEENKIPTIKKFIEEILQSELEHLAEFLWIKSLQEKGYKTYGYWCEDLRGLERARPTPGRSDRSEVGICMHLVQREGCDHSYKSDSWVVFNDTEEGGIRGMEYYLQKNLRNY
jgi:hypothetical protein